MSSTDSTPIEIWQCILRYVIGVMVFLDSDGVTIRAVSSMSEHHITSRNSPWNDERQYWAAERSRNACRRVCRSWNAYLGPFDNRFVRISDIVRGNIPVSAVGQAIRISFAPYDKDRTYVPHDELVEHQDVEWFSDAELATNLLGDMSGMKVKIVTAPYITFGTPCLTSLAIRFPNLVTLVNEGIDSAVGNALLHLPRIRHIYTGWYTRADSSAVFSCEHLETLSLHPQQMWGHDFDDDKWHLPSLHTLRILGGDQRPDGVAWEEMTMPLIRTLGPTLRSLYIAPSYLPGSFSNILRACPKLERLVGHPSGNPEMRLPASHPLHTLMVPFFSPWIAKPVKPSATWPGWPMVRTIIVDTPWDEARWGDQLAKWYGRWKKSPVIIEDSRGVLLKDWLKEQHL